MGNRSPGCKSRPLENADPCLFANRGFEALFSGVRFQGETRWPAATICTWRILGSIKNCVGLHPDTWNL